jgi:hypothetical protein
MTLADEDPRTLFTADEVAERLRVTKCWIYMRQAPGADLGVSRSTRRRAPLPYRRRGAARERASGRAPGPRPRSSLRCRRRTSPKARVGSGRARRERPAADRGGAGGGAGPGRAVDARSSLPARRRDSYDCGAPRAGAPLAMRGGGLSRSLGVKPAETGPVGNTLGTDAGASHTYLPEGRVGRTRPRSSANPAEYPALGPGARRLFEKSD